MGSEMCIRDSIIYDRIELIHEDKRDLLLADLRERTGLPITHVEIGELNFLRDSAEIKLFYPPLKNGWASEATTEQRLIS